MIILSAPDEERAIANARYGCPIQLELFLRSLARWTRRPAKLVPERETRYLAAVQACVEAPGFDRSPDNLMLVCSAIAVMNVRFLVDARASSDAVEAVVRAAAEEALDASRKGDLRTAHAYLAFCSRALGAKRSRPIAIPLGKDIAAALSALPRTTDRDGLVNVMRQVFGVISA